MSEKKPIVTIITASSNSGSYCIEELFEKYADRIHVRGVFRSIEKAKYFQEKYPNLEIVVGVDASLPETLNKAFVDAQSALIVTPHDPSRGFNDDAKLTENMINSAVENGVKYIVYVGSFTVSYSNSINIISSRFLPSEELLKNLSEKNIVKWTSLRGGFFMENFIGMFKQSLINDSIIRFPDIYVVPIDTRYIGKCAAFCLANQDEKHFGKFYEMNGPEMLDAQQISDIFSIVLQRDIKLLKLSEDDIKKMPLALYEIYSHFIKTGKNASPFTDHVQSLIGENGTLEQFIRGHIKEFS